MIYVKSPLRITLGGGGSDLPWYYKKKGGYVLSTSIDKFIYLFAIKRPYDKKIWLSYSKNEICNNINQIKNEIIRESFKYFKINNSIELHTVSDVPGNSGLGSSGAFISAILKFCSVYKNKKINKYNLAKLGCDVEMKKLKKNSGLQDQFVSVYGGMIEMYINRAGKVNVKNILLNNKIKEKFVNSCVTFFTNITRPSEQVLSSQRKAFTKFQDKERSMDEIVKIGKEIKLNLLKGDIKTIGKLFNEHWNIKKSLSNNMSNSVINKIYDYGMQQGAFGGKVIGAGGGGYIMFIINPKDKVKFIDAFKDYKLPIFNWNFSDRGTNTFIDKI